MSISSIGFVVLVADNRTAGCDFLAAIAYGIFGLFSLVMLLHSIKNVQWFDIADGSITIHCPFGMIRRVELNQIEKAFKTNAVIYRVKMLCVRRPHIALCLKKSVAKADTDDAYNGKKKPYIILPYSAETERLIRAEYIKMCGMELIIQ